MKQQLENIRLQALAALENADSPAALEELRVKFLGKKGELTAVLKMMGKLSAEERPAMGQLANQVRADLEAALDEASAKLAEAALAQQLLQLMNMRGLLPVSDRAAALEFQTGAQVADHAVCNRKCTDRTATVIGSHHIFPIIVKQNETRIRPRLLLVAGLYDIALSGAVAGIYFKRVYSGLLSALAHSIYACPAVLHPARKSIRRIMSLSLVLKLKLVLLVVKRICIYI